MDTLSVQFRIHKFPGVGTFSIQFWIAHFHAARDFSDLNLVILISVPLPMLDFCDS